VQNGLLLLNLDPQAIFIQPPMHVKSSYYYLLVLPVLMLALFQVGCSTDDEQKNETLQNERIIRQAIEQVNPDSIRQYAVMLEAMGTRFALAPNRREVALAIMDKLKNFGYEDVQLDSFALNRTWRNQYYETWQYNVVANLTGNVYPDSLVIIGAHHDCIVTSPSDNPMVATPGANDNASGVAVTLEVARILILQDLKPSSTVRFVTFAAEELGLNGSGHMANQLHAAQAKVKMMLNNDMVSYFPSSEPSSWELNIIDYPTSTSLRLTAQNLACKYTLLSTTNDNTHQQSSDSYPFALKGYPAIFFIAHSDDPNYHTLNDSVSGCNFSFASEVAKLSCALILSKELHQ
jgi:leucyl aminopeptidase